MSRIGNAPVEVPSGVEVKIDKGLVTVKGPKGELTQDVDTAFTVELKDNEVVVKRHTEQKLELLLGFSHGIVFELPEEIKVTCESERGKNPIVTLESHDKQLIGHVAAKIRSLRKPEPYKGKGIKFVGEQLRRKAGKSAAK